MKWCYQGYIWHLTIVYFYINIVTYYVLLQKKTCEDVVIISRSIVPAICKHFSMIDIIKSELLVQLIAYFKCTGINNDSWSIFITEYTTWKIPKSLVIYAYKADLVMMHAILLLSKLVPYTILLLKKLFYLSLEFRY